MMIAMNVVRTTVSRNGQISLPAPIRRRWGSRAVAVSDRGDYALIRPLPDDPIASLRGVFAGPGPTSEAMRAAERDAEIERERRRPGR
jgi:bifunctional DNA-binding transcriptional regulator/antitoxin component of YhaV-PrlF toxin-antitoxin module